ncbi:MAG: DUF6798 domain-containing protein [Gemmataceae bacterium]
MNLDARETQSSVSPPHSARVSWLPFVLAVAFALTYTQSPLFYSNQNQYLLHGLKNGGYGHLTSDWLAQTKDPTPLFSALIQISYQLAGLWPIQFVYFGILCGYFLLAWSLVKRLGFVDGSTPSLLGFTALLCLTHAAESRLLSVALTGVDYPWFLQAGVAGQYALGAGLQPSCFAVLFFASLVAYLKGRPVLASFLAASTSWFHATYLLPAAFLTVGYLANAVANRKVVLGIVMGLTAFMTALPSVIYVLVVFRPDDPVLFAESQRILATIRIPHHSVIARWFDLVAGLQLVWIVMGLFTIRKSILFRPLLTATVLAVLVTIVQWWTSNDTLALLFPWRLSVILVPLSTMIFSALLGRFIPTSISKVSIWFFALTGTFIMTFGLGYRVNKQEWPLLRRIHEQSKTDDCFLIPTKFPAVGKGHGSMSASFTPPPRSIPGSNLIPSDLQGFRLATGSPIYIDFKSIPYAPREVLEWEQRMKQAVKWYAEERWDREETIQELRNAGITHVVIPAGQVHIYRWGAAVYHDPFFTVYALPPMTSPRIKP